MSFVDIVMEHPKFEVRYVANEEPSSDYPSGSFEILFDNGVGKVSLDDEEASNLRDELEGILCDGKWPANDRGRDVSYYQSDDGTTLSMSFSVDKVWILSTTTFILSWDKLCELYDELDNVLDEVWDEFMEPDENLFALLKKPHAG